MKKFLSIALMVTVLSATFANATVRTVNNTSTSPGQYTDLQAAINASNAGDTILVSGSGSDYSVNENNGEITISKKITLYGTGYSPIKDIPAISNINQIHLQGGSSGTVIEGFDIGNQLYSDGGAGINNIVVRRNVIGDQNRTNTMNFNGDNWLIAENYVQAGIAINGNNTIIENNIINTYWGGQGSLSNNSGNTNLIFYNNIIAAAPTISFVNANVYNNIFYNNTGTNSQYFGGSSNCSFKNNIDYNNSNNNPFNIGSNNNTGSGNKLNTNPLFTLPTFYSDGDGNNIYIGGTNLTLKSTSPGHLAGTDGKDIGLYGGSGAQNPLTGVPPIPQISTMDIVTNQVAPGGIITVVLKAKSSN